MLYHLVLCCTYVWIFVFICFFECQSTYCSSLFQHCEKIGRTVHIVNLDPAAESFNYPVAMGEWGSWDFFGLIGSLYVNFS
jgi:hypothetical protein